MDARLVLMSHVVGVDVCKRVETLSNLIKKWVYDRHIEYIHDSHCYEIYQHPDIKMIYRWHFH